MSRIDPAEAWLKANDPEFKPMPKRPYEEIAVGAATDEGSERDPDSGVKHSTNHNAALFGATDYDGRLNGKRDGVRIDPNANGTETYEVVRDRTPERRKDRHKDKAARAAYMREYRARKRAES